MASGVNASDDMNVALMADGRAGTGLNAAGSCSGPELSWSETLSTLALDACFSAIFASSIYYVLPVVLPGNMIYVGLAVLLLLMAAWRVYRARSIHPDVPYTCGYASVGGKELFLVATVHISPRSPKDVEEVVTTVQPDVVMIELDEERLDRIRELPKSKAPLPEELQAITVIEAGQEPRTVHAQRAVWNAEWSGEKNRRGCPLC
eukprot:gnl/TRDRNA2_/TRDRNA2_129666_c0_seq1.p1 gnl/TRDRNA2_/TRDRNA2_129666_c0~~gnl/TRDRNA2_/TRDRNA2_129666_c0_seq1.p1  ORF type:complete len:231 (-),score=26.34 gnl/TRDRNA2_/TRDRNA2_129666_c0_seq1:458-1072(-)